MATNGDINAAVGAPPTELELTTPNNNAAAADDVAGAGAGAGAGVGDINIEPARAEKPSFSHFKQPDAGRKGKTPHLYYGKMKEYQDAQHPTYINDDGVATPFPLCCGAKTAMGYHALPCQQSPAEAGEMLDLGSGIIMYFKFVKFMAVIYFILSIMAVPSLVIYILGGKLDTVSQLSLVSQTTIGNLGESKVMCESVNDGSSLYLGCPEGAVIGRVEAYYGQPAGSCGCPLAQTPAPTCPGINLGTSCSPSDKACFFEAVRDVNLPSGEKFTAPSCCAKTLDVDGLPDFSGLDIKTTDNCNSPTAQAIVAGKCVGNVECRLTVGPTNNVTWAPNSAYKTWCPGRSSADTVGGVVQNCTDTFSSGGGLDSCAGGRFAVRRLVVVAQCFDTTIRIGDRDVDKAELIVIVGICDFFSCLIFLAAWLWLRHKQARSIARDDYTTTSAGDYTIMLTNLPPLSAYHTVSELDAMLRSHIEKQLTHHAEPVTNRLGGLKDTPRRPVKIANINFGMTNGLAIETLKLHGAYVHRLETLDKSYQILMAERMRKKGMLDMWKSESHTLAHDIAIEDSAEMSGLNSAVKVPNDMRRAFNNIQDKLQQLRSNVRILEEHKHRQQAVVAFVTFEEEEGVLRALTHWPNDLYSRLTQSNEKRLENGAYRMYVERAPEPSDIYWENLEVKLWGRIWRGTLTAFVSLLLVFVTVVLMFIAESTKRENLRKFPSVDCNSIDDKLNRTLVIQDVLWDTYNLTSGNVGRLECYCKAKLFAGSVSDIFGENFGVPDKEGNYFWCQEWITTWSINRGLTYGGVAGVLIINMLMRNVLKNLVAFERPKTQTDALVSVGTKLFIVQVLNTAFIVLLVNARIRSEVDWLRTGEYDDFSTSWFATVGTSILMTMGFNILIPHLAPIGRSSLLGCIRCVDRSCTCNAHYTRKKTQEDYQNLYTQQSFRLSERYAAVLNTMFVTLAYSSGLPLLMPFAFVSTALAFWVDKFFLLRQTRAPPHLSTAMAQRTTALMPWALGIHLMFGIWMLGNTNIVANEALQTSLSTSDSAAAQSIRDTIAAFDPGYNLNTRLFGEHVLPLTILFLLLIAVTLIYRLIIRRVPECVALFGCFREVDEGEDIGNYFEAISRTGIIQILQQGFFNIQLWPKYMRTAEKWAYHDTVEMLYKRDSQRDAPQPDPQRTTPPSIYEPYHLKGLRSVLKLRQLLAANDDRARAVAEYFMGEGYIRVSEQLGGSNRDLEERFTDDEIRSYKMFWPDISKLMPDGHHSYDIHENPEYRRMFALDAELAQAEQRGVRTKSNFVVAKAANVEAATIVPPFQLREIDFVVQLAMQGSSSTRDLGHSAFAHKPSVGRNKLPPLSSVAVAR